MSAVFDFYPPGEQKQRHIDSAQNGKIDVRVLDDGSIQVLGVHVTRQVIGQNGETVRAATRREGVLATYPAGTRVEQVAR